MSYNYVLAILIVMGWALEI